MPVANIKIDSKKCDFGSTTKISSIEIFCGVGASSSRCIVKIIRPFSHFQKNRFTPGQETDFLKAGSAITVELGYTSGKTQVCDEAFEGFIARVEVHYSRELVELTLECMDTKMWMMAGEKSKRYHGVNYSGIVKSVLNESYLTSRKIKKTKIEITGEPKKLFNPIYQYNQSDYEFLSYLAELTGSFFFIYLGTAYFVSPCALKSDFTIAIGPSNHLTDISWGYDVLGISKGVMFQGSNPEAKQKVSSNMITRNLRNIGTGFQSPETACSGNLKSYTERKVSSPLVETVDEANFLSQAGYTKSASNFVKCKVVLKGCASKRIYPCMGVQIKDFGSPLNNTYILTGIHHKFDGIKMKFVTEFILSSDCFTLAAL